MLLFAYIAAAIVVGFLGRHRHIGFGGFLIVALLATPPLALIILMISHRRQPPFRS